MTLSRQSKFTAADKVRIISEVAELERGGTGFTKACQACGVGPTTMRQWRRFDQGIVTIRTPRGAQQAPMTALTFAVKHFKKGFPLSEACAKFNVKQPALIAALRAMKKA